MPYNYLQEGTFFGKIAPRFYYQIKLISLPLLMGLLNPILRRSTSFFQHLLTVTLIYGWELGEMLASSGTALAAEFFGTMTAAIYPDASRSTLRS